MTYIRANGVILSVEMGGSGEPVVLLADIGEDLGSWAFQWRTLSISHFTIALDVRGSGRSDAPSEPYSMETMADDVVSIMDLTGVDGAHVIGHGMGGMIAQVVAADHPGRVNSIVTICTPARMTDDQRCVYSTLLRSAEEGMDPVAMSKFMTPWVFSAHFLEDERWRDNVISGRARRYSWISWEGVRGQFEAMSRYDATRHAGRIACPCLAICGKHDRLVPPPSVQELMEHVPRVRGVQLDGGHMLPLELLRSLAKEEMDFLDGVDG